MNMSLNELIKSKIVNSRIYGVSKPLVIKEMYCIPNDINIKKLNKKIDSYYDSFYIKKEWAKAKPTKEERISNFLNTNKVISKRYDCIPKGDNKESYRKISVINTLWLKKSQKKFNKYLMNILLTDKIRGKKQESIVPYLHSSVKQRSYVTNANTHIGNKYVLALDLKDFYPSVTKKKICNFFVNEFNLPYDIAMFYAVLSTCKSDDNVYKLGQGLSQSATLAYLVNYKLFNYIYEFALKDNIEMSIYVDDIIFSSSNPIPQKFINKLFGIIKDNGMEIKKKKVHNYKRESIKKITGVYINGKKTRVAAKKHEEINIQYKYLKKNIILINKLDDYYNIYNLYLRFYGNYQHILMVEKKVQDKFEKFIIDYDNYFPKGINKKQKNYNYQRGNIKNISDSHKINSCYQRLKNKNNKLRER